MRTAIGFLIALIALFCALPIDAARRRAVSPDNPAPPADIAFVSERDGNSEIYVVNLDGTGLVRLTNSGAIDMEPAWSPDGKRIAFVSDRAGAGWDIFIMDADGSNLVRRTQIGSTYGPAWSPDGTRIAFSSLRDGQFRIQVMSADEDGAEPVPIGFERGANGQPAWTSDGNRIAFVSDPRYYDGCLDIYVVNADGSQLMPLIEAPSVTQTLYFQPAWSPDGRKIAVAACPYVNCYPTSSIMIANADGSGLSTLRATAGYSKPTWSPDSSTIAFSYQFCRACVPELRYVSADGSRSGLIVLDGHDPAWRPLPEVTSP